MTGNKVNTCPLTGFELKQCPFCGSDADLRLARSSDVKPEQFWIFCFTCKACGPYIESIDEAKKAWNTRTIPEGFALVPIVPTQEMVRAMDGTLGLWDEEAVQSAYYAMIGASGNSEQLEGAQKSCELCEDAPCLNCSKGWLKCDCDNYRPDYGGCDCDSGDG